MQWHSMLPLHKQESRRLLPPISLGCHCHESGNPLVFFWIPPCAGMTQAPSPRGEGVSRLPTGFASDGICRPWGETHCSIGRKCYLFYPLRESESRKTALPGRGKTAFASPQRRPAPIVTGEGSGQNKHRSLEHCWDLRPKETRIRYGNPVCPDGVDRREKGVFFRSAEIVS